MRLWAAHLLLEERKNVSITESAAIIVIYVEIQRATERQRFRYWKTITCGCTADLYWRSRCRSEIYHLVDSDAEEVQ